MQLTVLPQSAGLDKVRDSTRAAATGLADSIYNVLGRHREGRRGGVELLKDLHGFLRTAPPS